MNKLIMMMASLLLWSSAPIPATAQQLSIGIGFPSVSIGINVPLYPELVPVPGYPVYYAPQLGWNYFFYDGLYWVYFDDNWYSAYWYNGPWWVVEPVVVPVFVLRVPVRYYRQPPVYFRAWQPNAPPRWGEHWGRDWEQRRSGWDQWNRSSASAPAPLPVYQRQYSGGKYPRVEQQPVLQKENYHYQPRDPVARQQYKAIESAPASAQQKPGQQQQTGPKSQGKEIQQQPSQQRPAPKSQGKEVQREEPAEQQQSAAKARGKEAQQQPAQQQPAQQQQSAPKSQGKKAKPEPKQEEEQKPLEQEKEKGGDGRDNNRQP